MSWHITYRDEDGTERTEALTAGEILAFREAVDLAEGLPRDPDLEDDDDEGDAA